MANMAASKAELNPTLFPILHPARASSMLARLAAEAEAVDAGHDVEFRALPVRSVLNKTVSKRMKWMVWSINPYRGCEFGCRYCYARYTHEFLAPAPAALSSSPAASELSSRPERSEVEGSACEPRSHQTSQWAMNPNADPSAALRDDSLENKEEEQEPFDLRDPEAFERIIFLKQNAAWLLHQDLQRLARQGRQHEEIALGTATDPWQPIERRTRLTRSLLEVLAQRDGLRLGVVTKSTLIERDLDLLLQIHQRSSLVVHITITTPDAELARKLEPRAPRPDLRFQTVARLRAAGIRCGILNSPLLPGITDSAEAIDRMAARAKAADASFFAANPLFLKPCSRPTYFDFIREHFPHLKTLYEEKYSTMDFAARPYRERLRALVVASCARHGLHPRSMETLLAQDGNADPAPGSEKRNAGSVAMPSQARLFA